MLDSYPYYFIKNCNDENYAEKVKLYRFKSTKSRKTYIVRVEKYPHSVYVIKFYLKNHSLSKNKYRLLTNDFEPRRIIYSCINILNGIYREDEKSSFAFVGSNLENEELANNKRFRFYKTIVTTLFGDTIFLHYESIEKSAYLLLRRTELEEKPKILRYIQNYFNTVYELSE